MNGKSRLYVAIVAPMLAFAGIALSISPARAVTSADVRAGVYTDNGGVGLGGGLITSIGAHRNWYFNPNVEAALGDRSDQVAVSADIHYDFRSESPYSAYLGGGPALMWRQPETGDRETSPGMNLLGGLVGKRGDVRPFVQMKGVLADRNQVAVMGGVRF